MDKETSIRLLKWSHVGLRTLYIIYACFLFVWSILSLIEGFSTDLFHISFWLGYEIMYITICLTSTGYGVQSITEGVTIETPRNIFMAGFCTWLTAIAFVKNTVHIIFASLELAEQTSVLAVKNYWFLVIFAALLACLMLMNVGAMFQFYWYKKHLRLFQTYTKNKKG